MVCVKVHALYASKRFMGFLVEGLGVQDYLISTSLPFFPFDKIYLPWMQLKAPSPATVAGQVKALTGHRDSEHSEPWVLSLQTDSEEVSSPAATAHDRP